MRRDAGLEVEGTVQRRAVAPKGVDKAYSDDGMDPENENGPRLSATARSFAILEHVAKSHAPVEVLDIIAALKLPKASAYRLVDWFIGQGYLAREPGRRRLVVGPRLTDLAFGALSSSMRNDTPHIVLQRLVRSLNETCNIGTLLNGEVVYLDRVEADHWPLRLHFSSGSRVPLHCSAIGKLYLALASSARRKRLLHSLELRKFTGNTLTDCAQLEAELKQIRKEQVSFDREEYLLGVVCMAVPVIGKNGEMLAALAVQGPEARMSAQGARRHLPALREAANELSELFQPKPSSLHIAIP
ncbi:MAG TPA: IclR family transcriptional regulator [Xanthobacteraceae bacterium]|jgi:DNA-binding IclR family transcriptional regulator|nr:IclR family transcriptional regulator [Xanthobacteraceae bacterium]